MLKKLFNRHSEGDSHTSEEILCGCGHHSKLKKKVQVGDKKFSLRIKYKPGKQPPYCLDCIEKMTITCPWCGKPILIGDYVTLYKPSDPNFKVPEGAVVYSEEPFRLVGCQRRSCAQSGADYCGIWDVPGKVKRFQSALEQAMMTGEPVFMNF